MSSDAQFDGDRYAVVIGCENYAALPVIPNAVADANKPVDALRAANYAFVAMTDAALDGAGVHDPDLFYPKRDNLSRQIAAFLPAHAYGPEDTLLFFFTGHGLQLSDGRDFLAPLDAPANPTENDLINLASLIDQLIATGAGNILVVVDACRRTGPGLNIDGRFGEFTAQHLPTKPGLQLAFLRACQPGQQSWPDARGGSAFVSALSESFGGGSEDVTLDALYDRVRRTVLSQTRQTGLPQTAALATSGAGAGQMSLAAVTCVVIDDDEDDAVVVNEPATPAGVPTVAANARVTDLAAAVAAARPGDTLQLHGSYALAAPLTIDKPLTLEGEGRDHCHVISASAGFVVRFQGRGPWTVSGIDFEHTGQEVANTVQVDGGAFTASACRFAGATTNQQLQNGSGLNLSGSTVAAIENCLCELNGWGIAYVHSTGGSARHNTCSQNRFTGISVQEQAQPTLEGNDCQNNERCGIRYAQSAAGSARNNTCSQNKYHGIEVQGQARPKLEGNECRNNKQCGIVYFGSAAGIARNNRCSGNNACQILIASTAHPSLDNNIGKVSRQQ